MPRCASLPNFARLRACQLPANVIILDPPPAHDPCPAGPAACSQVEAEAYCRLHGGRLLTEPEYEHAAASEAAASGALRQLEGGGWEWTGSTFGPLPGWSRRLTAHCGLCPRGALVLRMLPQQPLVGASH